MHNKKDPRRYLDIDIVNPKNTRSCFLTTQEETHHFRGQSLRLFTIKLDSFMEGQKSPTKKQNETADREVFITVVTSASL